MDYQAGHEKSDNRLSVKRHAVLVYTVFALVSLICTGSCGRHEAGASDILVLTLQAKSDRLKSAAIDTLRKRAAALGAAMDDLVRIDPKTVSVRLSGYKEDVNKAVRVMEKRGLLEFRLVDERVDVASAKLGKIPPDDEILYKIGRNHATGEIIRTPYVTRRQALMTGDVLTDAGTQRDYSGNMMVEIKFNDHGAREFERITGEHIGERLAIVLDDKVYAAPVIKDRISGGTAIIEGSFTPEEAEELALVLRYGPLTAPVEVVKTEWVNHPSASR